MLMKPLKPRQFTYRPRYYQPEVDEEKPRIQFRRHALTKYKPKQRSVLVMIVLIIIIISLLRYWMKIESVERNEFKFDNLKIEEIR